MSSSEFNLNANFPLQQSKLVVQRLEYMPPEVVVFFTPMATFGGGVNIFESQSGGGDLSS